jgi:O-antigen ligase
MPARAASILYGISLFTMPWCGVGTLKVVTGRDWGFGLQPSWIFLAAAVGFSVLAAGPSRFWPRSGQQRSVALWLTLSMAAVLVSGAGIWLAPSGEAAGIAWGRFGRQVVQLLIMIMFLAWSALWIRGRERWQFTLRWLLAGALAQLAYALLQQWHYYLPGPVLPALESVFTSNPAILSGSEELYLGDTFRHVPRLRGTMCEPLYLGNYLLLLLPWAIWARRWWPRASALGAGLLLLLVLTWSRGAWFGLAGQATLLLILLLAHRSRAGRGRLGAMPGPRLLWPAAVILVAMLAGLVFSDWALFRFPRERFLQTFSSTDWSNLTRIYSMQAAWRAFLLSPLLGVGWGQYAFHFPALVDPQGLQSQFTWPVVNNFPLKVLCETGLVGFLTFLLAAARWLAAGWRQALCRGWEHPALPALVGVTGVWMQTLTFSQYNLPHIWLAAGLLIAATGADGRKDDLP